MNFKDYQQQAWSTADYPDYGKNLYYPTLGLTGEAGEVSNIIKKVMRDHDNKVRRLDKAMLKNELGDVLWYVAALATELKLDLQKIAEANLKKLHSRQLRGTLHGSGDNR